MKLRKGMRIEVDCVLHGWGECACIGIGPWILQSARSDSDGRLSARHATKDCGLGAHESQVRKYRR